MSLYQKILFRILFKLNILLHLVKFISRYIHFKDTLFLVYASGKTGSSTVYYTLMKEFPLNKVLHVHLLSDYWIKEKIPKQSGVTNKKVRNQVLAYKVYKAVKKKKKIKVITLIRDPFSRGISAYFHNPALRKQAKNKDLETIRREIIDYAKDLSLDWFKTDFNNFFNCNIFDYAFDKTKGIKKINLMDKFEVLLLKNRQLRKIGKQEIGGFLGITIDSLFNVNQRDETSGGDIYNKVKDYYFEDKDSFNEKFNSQFTQHFFDNDELESFRLKYLKE
jgi:hypothetical protein